MKSYNTTSEVNAFYDETGVLLSVTQPSDQGGRVFVCPLGHPQDHFCMYIDG